MTAGPRPPPPRHVPTLTEVLDPRGRVSAPMPGPPAAPAALDEELVRRVMGELHRRLDDTLEPRLRAAIAPAVDAVAGALLTEARALLDDLLHQAVRDAVAKELARRRDPPSR
ncbi:MAG TPA: hypothetical protein VLI72_03640 [Methylibium sp.]|nr:hypothetical protein [Methylibium sp.]